MPATAKKGHAAPTDDTPTAKRRNIRKGTRSCWECKRRKARCTFADDSDTVCVGCSRRGSVCVSQEYPEETSQACQPDERRLQHFARIGQMVVKIVKEEAILETSAKPEPVDAWDPGDVETVIQDIRYVTSNKTSHSQITTEGANQNFPSIPSTLNAKPSDQVVQPRLAERPQSSTTATSADAGFPTPQDVATISRVLGVRSAYSIHMMFLPHKLLDPANFGSFYHVPDIYAPEPQPVLQAKKLLILAIFIQSIQPCSEKELDQLSASPTAMVTRLMKAANACTGARNFPATTIEELECLMLEGLLLANGGHLRRAWLVFRRLVADAQLLGVHRAHHVAKYLDPENKLSIPFFWFRILYIERLLSLLLGLPQASTDCTVGDEEALLAEEYPMARLERMHCVILSKLLERNETAQNSRDQDQLRDIDRELQRAAQLMPARWWLAPNLSGITNEKQRFWDTMRLMSQLFHHFLILQLHLPYMLRSSQSPRYNHSKMICASSSREVLMRFIESRSNQTVVFHNRAVDFFALIASMTLLLAHIDSPQGAKEESLVHQRPVDRAVTEQAMEYMDEANRSSPDMLSQKSADVVRSLLDVENEAFNKYNTKEETAQTFADQKREGENCGMQLNIPNIGAVHITSEGIVRRPASRQGVPTLKQSGLAQQDQAPLDGIPQHSASQVPGGSDLDNQHQSAGLLDTFSEPMLQSYDQQPFSADFGSLEEESVFQGVDMAYFDRLFKGVETSEELAHSDLYGFSTCYRNL
ncbi:hypothetical protein FDECE_7115 [Fusarium decemcellulare]|nr:hypothetical protein FDECE_7115 [Fusarium decemcellulare]